MNNEDNYALVYLGQPAFEPLIIKDDYNPVLFIEKINLEFYEYEESEKHEDKQNIPASFYKRSRKNKRRFE